MTNCKLCEYTWSTRTWTFDNDNKIRVCDDCYKLLKSKPGYIFGQPPKTSTLEKSPKTKRR